jgi:hypothetical protein
VRAGDQRDNDMRCLPTAAALLLTLQLAACDSPATTRDEQAALAAAQRWLTLSDGGDHAAAWSLSSNLFRMSVSKENWDTNQTRYYRMFGVPDHRDFIAAKFTPSVPGGEPGDHVVIEYRRRIKAGDTILEVLYMHHTGDGWRTAGYRMLDEH